MISDKILPLSDECINQIAAGEVIERPSSVVKELVENSLDAGATSIKITLAQGGRDLISIQDDGKGIRAEDLELCFTRHATSKIRTPEELISVSTGGFRGEAMSSIASVAQVTLQTVHKDESTAWKVHWNGEGFQTKEEIAWDRGTRIEVKDLFYNTPVRRKFLASAQTETSRILDIVTRLAIAHPQVRFEVRQGIKEHLSLTQGDLFGRCSEIFGATFATRLLELSWSDGYCNIEGMIGREEQARGRRSHQFIYLNRRPIWNPMIAKALSRAYEQLMPGKHPVAVLFLELPIGEFDVNVHPAKKEVRFSREDLVFSAIVRAVRETLRENESTPLAPQSSSGNTIALPGESENSIPLPTLSKDPVSKGLVSKDPVKNGDNACKERVPFKEGSPLKSSGSSGIPKREAADCSAAEPAFSISQDRGEAQEQDLFATDNSKFITLSNKDHLSNQSRLQNEQQQDAEEFQKTSDQNRYYQLAGRYIICEDSEAMILIDQNAAHQRILFEQAVMRMDEGVSLDSQQLLFPEVIHFIPAEYELVEKERDNLSRLAYDLEPFGPDCFQLRGIPAELPPSHAEASIREIVEELNNPAMKSFSPRENLALAYARGTAIQAGDLLNSEKMGNIMDGLFATQNPYTSPSGRPCIMRFPLSDLDKKFKR